MVIKLNGEQKKVVMKFLCEDKGIGELLKFFYTCDSSEIMAMDIEINDKCSWTKWWNLVVNGETVTQLNFECYPKVLKQIQKLA